jgi:hypothetical protein
MDRSMGGRSIARARVIGPLQFIQKQKIIYGVNLSY